MVLGGGAISAGLDHIKTRHLGFTYLTLFFNNFLI